MHDFQIFDLNKPSHSKTKLSSKDPSTTSLSPSTKDTASISLNYLIFTLEHQILLLYIIFSLRIQGLWRKIKF